MRKSASKTDHRNKLFAAKGKQASVLRRRKYELARGHGLPADLLGGSLTLTHRRCGKSGCHCASGEGHSMWTLTYSVEGAKQVLVIPNASVPLLEPLVKEGRRWREALAELLAINAQLVRLWRQEHRHKRKVRRPASKRRD